MTEFREKLDPLYSFIVTVPGVKPFLWDVRLVVFLPEVWWRLDETFIPTCELIRGAMVNSGCSVSLTCSGITLFGILQALLSSRLILLHEVLLVFSQLCLLWLEFSHTFVESPWTFEFARTRISKFLSFLFYFFSFRFPRLFLFTFFNTSLLSDIHATWKPSSVWRVHSKAFVLKTVHLVHELTMVQLRILQESCQVILLVVDFVFSVKSSSFLHTLM